MESHAAIIEEHRAAIERTAERLSRAVEEVDRVRALEAAMLRERLGELDQECEAELREMQAQHRAAEAALREKFRRRAEDERAKSEARARERADALLAFVEPSAGAGGGRGGSGAVGGGKGVVSAAQQQKGGRAGADGGGGVVAGQGLRAKAAASVPRVIRGIDFDDD